MPCLRGAAAVRCVSDRAWCDTHACAHRRARTHSTARTGVCRRLPCARRELAHSRSSRQRASARQGAYQSVSASPRPGSRPSATHQRIKVALHPQVARHRATGLHSARDAFSAARRARSSTIYVGASRHAQSPESRGARECVSSPVRLRRGSACCGASWMLKSVLGEADRTFLAKAGRTDAPFVPVSRPRLPSPRQNCRPVPFMLLRSSMQAQWCAARGLAGMLNTLLPAVCSSSRGPGLSKATKQQPAKSSHRTLRRTEECAAPAFKRCHRAQSALRQERCATPTAGVTGQSAKPQLVAQRAGHNVTTSTRPAAEL